MVGEWRPKHYCDMICKPHITGSSASIQNHVLFLGNSAPRCSHFHLLVLVMTWWLKGGQSITVIWFINYISQDPQPPFRHLLSCWAICRRGRCGRVGGMEAKALLWCDLEAQITATWTFIPSQQWFLIGLLSWSLSRGCCSQAGGQSITVIWFKSHITATWVSSTMWLKVSTPWA